MTTRQLLTAALLLVLALAAPQAQERLEQRRRDLWPYVDDKTRLVAPTRWVDLTDGKGFAFVRRDGGRFQIATQDFATRQVQVLTGGPGDESPSIAPNGKLILYANEVGGRGILAAVSSDGRIKQRLVAPATDVREPAWGPYARP